MAIEFLKQKKGYTLVSILLIFTLISIIGLSLVGMTMSSHKVVSNEKKMVEDKSEAEMAIEEAMARIQRGVDNLNRQINNESSDPEYVSEQLDLVLQEVRKFGKNALGNNKYTLEITDDPKENLDNGLILKYIDIKAPVGNSGKQIRKRITLSTIADQFKYTSVSPGNLVLNGAPYLKGDVLVGGNLISHNEGKFIKWSLLGGNDYWVKTSYPAIDGNLTVNGKFYHNKIRDADQFEPTEENLQKYFSYRPTIMNRNVGVTPIDIAEKVQNKKHKINSATTFDYLIVGKNEKRELNGDLKVKNNLIIKPGGKLIIKNGSVNVYGGAELTGSLILESDDSYIYIDEPTKINDFDFKGQMYVEANIEISGNFNTNGTVYSTGKVEIEDMHTNNKKGTLVILAEDEIQIANNNEYQNTPKELDAYFYTNSKLEIYGIGSNLRIHGGISGNPIILNATKGRTDDGWFNDSFSVGPLLGKLYFQENQDKLDYTLSRLSVFYKEDMILNPPAGIPTVNKVQMEELDYEYE